MKAEAELRQAIRGMTAVLLLQEEPLPSTKEEIIRRLAHLVATLEVFTDLNFTEEEQSRLFNISAIRLKELQEKLK